MRGVWLLFVMAFMVCVVVAPFGSGAPRSVSQVSFEARDSSPGYTTGAPVLQRLLWPIMEATDVLDAALAI